MCVHCIGRREGGGVGKGGVCDRGKDGDPGQGALESEIRVSITGVCIRWREEKRMRGGNSDHCNGGG